MRRLVVWFGLYQTAHIVTKVLGLRAADLRPRTQLSRAASRGRLGRGGRALLHSIASLDLLVASETTFYQTKQKTTCSGSGGEAPLGVLFK